MTSSNVDQNEINKFAQLADEWWNVDGKLKTLHDINPTRMAYIEQHADLQGKQVLDLGCGGGILSEALAKAGAKVTAIDMDSHAIEAAKHHLSKSKLDINYQYISSTDLAEQQPNGFDIIVCMEMLEHVPEPKQILTDCAALLKPNGQLFLSTLNRTPKAYMLGIIGAEYILRLLPCGTHDYSKFIRPSELKSWLQQSDFEFDDLKGMNYNPFNRDANLSDDVSINYLVHARN